MTYDDSNYCCHNRLSAFGVIGTSWLIQHSGFVSVSHNRLSAFGVSGTEYIDHYVESSSKSQSPFGFWGDWNDLNRGQFSALAQAVTIAFRLLG